MWGYESSKSFSALGFPIFEELLKPTTATETLFCKSKNIVATGKLIDDGFVVYKGSTAVAEQSKSAGTFVASMRTKLLEGKFFLFNSDHYIFVEVYLFSSPSAASVIVLGRNSNGWTEWKNGLGLLLIRFIGQIHNQLINMTLL